MAALQRVFFINRGLKPNPFGNARLLELIGALADPGLGTRFVTRAAWDVAAWYRCRAGNADRSDMRTLPPRSSTIMVTREPAFQQASSAVSATIFASANEILRPVNTLCSCGRRDEH